MIITTLIVCFLLACLPLVIATLSFRYAANIFSTAVVTLSAVSFLLGLAQFGLLLGLSYRLFSPTRMPQAQLAVQYVSIFGGLIMILAGLLWVGYFRKLIGEKSAVPPSLNRTKTSAGKGKTLQGSASSQKRREAPRPKPDWFSPLAPGTEVFPMPAVIAGKARPQAKTPRAKKSPGKGVAEQSLPGLGL